jgi:type VI protein secretion system component Hcp
MAIDLFLVIPRGKPSIQAPPVTDTSLKTTFGDDAVLVLNEFSLGATNQPSTSAAGGAGAGKATLRRLVVKRPIDSVSPQLFNVLATGQHFTTVQLYGRKGAAQGGGKPYLGYEFQAVFVSDIAWTSDPDDAPTETVTFAYGGMYIGVRPLDAKGEPSTPMVKHGWSTVTNSPPQDADHLFPG